MKKNFYTLKIHVLQFAALSVLFTLMFSSMAIAQTTAVIRGKVTDAATSEAVPGATVMIKGNTASAVATDANGNYSITVTIPAILDFKFVGYSTQEIPILKQEVLNVKFVEATEQLGEVQITTALGISKADREIGYSVSTVKGATLTEVRQNSVVNELEGRVAGVNVSGVATGPNGATNVIIRGLTSLTGNNQPLYVLNGVPLVNNNYGTTDVQSGYGGHDDGDGIGDINPDDIESMSILKGAAATALYGYRGANGVVLITTKKGKAGDGLGIEVHSNYQAEDVIDETDFQEKYGQGYNGVPPVNGGDALGSMESSWGGLLNGRNEFQFDGVLRPYSAVAKGNLGRFYKQGTDLNNTVAFNKSWDDDDNTRFSFGELQDNSYVPNSGLQRFTFNQNTNLKFGKNFTLVLSSQYVSEYTKNPPSVSDEVANLNFGSQFLPPNVNILYLAGPNGNGTDANGNEENPFADVYTTNPYFSAYEFQSALHRNRFTGSANLKYTSDDGYFVGFQVADDYLNDRNTNITPDGTAYEPTGDMYEQNVKQTELNLDLTFGKDYKFSKDFGMNLLFGGNYRQSVQEYVTASGQVFATPDLYNIGNLEVLQESYNLNHEQFQSIYGTAEFSYKNYLYLTTTGRNDWYSTLAPGKVTYLYPSVSASFVYSELLKIPNMDLGKLRLSYADVGGEADSPYSTLQTYGIGGTLTVPGGSYPLGFAGSGQVPNSGLVPSKRTEYEIGTEDDFFNNRLRFDVAFYHKNVINDILPVTIDYTSGYNSALLNVGNVRDDGVEFEVGGTPVKNDKFSWDIDLNGSYINSKVLSLGGQPYISLGSVEGDSTPDGNSVANVQQVVGKAPSQIIAFDAARNPNGSIIIDPEYGSPDPNVRVTRDWGSAFDPWSGGITNSFKYDHFDLNFLIDAKFGGKIFSNTNYIAYVEGLSKETLSRDPAGYGTDHITAAQYYSNYANSDVGQFVYNAGFIKFRSINLGYTFPTSWLNNKIHSLHVSFFCHNVFTIKKWVPNVDPESSYSASIYSQGLENPSVPYSRTYGFNLDLKL
jgi:TonB-linked SusC/RagA family outer membrane protein